VARIEKERFESPLLAELGRALSAEGMPASRRIAQLARLVGWYESRRNVFYAVLVAPLLLPTQFALAIHVWRSRFGAAVAGWLRAAATIEALASLAAWHHEHPAFPFPALVPDAEGPLLDGDELGHPLIPAARRVPNDVRLGRERRLLMVSGSNMSGKSTYLRTVGTNVVLALAGAPVCARRFTLSHFDLGATLRVNDSLQGGQSRFFAEILRIKQVMALAQRSPLTLGLLDEILQGTNSHDRLLGAKGVVKALLDAGALGIVTTHDLALARLADDLGPLAANVHFEDRIEDGKLVFDYRMREGVVARTNALDLMRLVGLKV
jgi:DNA mismatch repair ATPase MutS